MFNKKSSLGRAVLLSALVLFLSVGFIACQREAEYPGYIKVGDVKAYDLKATDPICGDWNGSWGLTLKCNPDFVWATVASATVLADPEGKNPDTYITVNEFGTDVNYNKDSSDIYVVYNFKDGKVNKYEGVLLFIAKTSAWGSPEAGKWYGVKFQIDESNPNKALIEGGYNSAEIYNKVSSLDKAVELFAYDNSAYYAESSWTESASGANRSIE